MKSRTEHRSYTGTGDLQFYEFRLKLKNNWYWFFVSAAICSVLAFLYLEITPDIYQRTASVLVKDEANNSMSEISAFEDLGLFKTGTNVNNEIRAFRSPFLISDVVKRLELDVSYKIKKRLKYVELYHESPVILSLPESPENTSFSFALKLLPDGKFSLSDFEGMTKKKEEVITGKLSDTILTPVGPVIISPSFFFSEDYYYRPIRITKSDLSSVANAFLHKTTVALSGINTTIINLTIRDESMRRSDDFLNTLISVYNEKRIEDNSRIAVNTSNFINERLLVIEKELGGIDSDIEVFKSSNLLTDVQAAGERFMNESSEYSSQAFDLNNQRSVARFIKEYMEDRNNTDELLPINSGINNLNIESQINDYNTLLLKRDNLMSNSSGQNPVVMEMNNSLKSMRQSIVRTIDNLIVTLGMQISGIKSREAQTKKRIASNPGQEKKLISIERQQKIKEALYLYLLQKREENELSKEITISNTRIITPATGENKPVEPNGRIILLLALVAGFIIPPVLMWIKAMFTNSVRGKNDITTHLTIPYIGDIPKVPGRMIRKSKCNLLVIDEKKRDVVNEAFRIVRSNIGLIYPDAEKPEVILFTSLNPRSGKTFISVNMAMSIALTGSRTVIIDLDLRKASLSKCAGSRKYGVTEYLKGMTDNIDDLIATSFFYENLDLIPAGMLTVNPVELLLNHRLEELLRRLKGRYDTICIDCTPAEIVADPSIISRFADLTVFIIRKGFLDRQLLPEVEELFKSRKLTRMAVLLNCSNHVGRYGSYCEN